MTILSRYRVLDLTRVRSGPSCVRILSDWGADVIAVERAGENGEADLFAQRDGSDFQNLHRNKRSVALDLRKPKGRDIFLRLVDTADVVIENYRPDVKHRLRIDYEALKARNPRIVYASISGFGEAGPYANRPGFDQIAQGMSGLMSITGEPGRGPMRAGVAMGDLAAGLYTAIGILLALLAREQTGEGQWVRTSLLASQIAMLDFQAARWLVDGVVPKQVGNNHPTNVPTNMYATADGYVNIAATADNIFARLCKGLGIADWACDPVCATPKARAANRDIVNAKIEEITRTRASAEWVESLNALGVPCGPIYTIDQTYADPQVQSLGLVGKVHHALLGELALQASPLQMSGATQKMRVAAPECGEHTEAVLRELGVPQSEIDALRREGVVQQSSTYAQAADAVR
jgi:formyl-CoA transferase